MEKPFTGVVFTADTENSDAIRYNVGIKETTDDATKMQQRLSEAGIASTLLNQPTHNNAGTAIWATIPRGVIITGDNIQAFVNQGGSYVKENSLRNVSFQRKPGQDSVYADSNPVVNAILTKQGIPFTENQQAITISDPTGLCVAVLSGARFNGSEEFLTQNGFDRSRR